MLRHMNDSHGKHWWGLMGCHILLGLLDKLTQP
jgi:hypothetical protein